MLLCNFNDDLNQYIEIHRGRSGASKASTMDLEKTGIEARGPIERGRMYTFRYFNANEKFYDTYPIVIGLDNLNKSNQMGINLHYIPFEARIPFIEDIIKSFSYVFESELKNAGNPEKQMFIKNFTYEAIKKSLGKKYNLAYAIRTYKIGKIKKPRLLGYEDWYLGAVNDDNFFFGGDINQAQLLYYTNI
jgi:hypothetical protein